MAVDKQCAPGADIINPSSAVHNPGAYIVTNGDIILVTATPGTPSNTAAGDPCDFLQYTNWDTGPGAETLGAWFCWNGSSSWYDGGLNATCTAYPTPVPWPPFFSYPMQCDYHSWGLIDNGSSSYSNPTNLWANFYNTYNWGNCNGGVGMRMYVPPNGAWWQFSFNFGC